MFRDCQNGSARQDLKPCPGAKGAAGAVGGDGSWRGGRSRGAARAVACALGGTMEEYELIVIGSGPAGRRAAVQAAKLGKSVLVVEGRRRVGGVSVHTGTIPSKTLRETALNLSGWRERGFYGHSYRVKQEIGGDDLGVRLMKTLEHEINVLEHQFHRNKIRTVNGTARFTGPNEVAVRRADGSDLAVRGERILITVGTIPYRPDSVPFDGDHVVDSDAIVEAPSVPRSLTVIGAGVIGIEYATIFSAMDVPVTLIEPRDTFLDFIDREIIDTFTHELRDRGMVIRTGAEVRSIEKGADGWVTTTLADGRTVRTEMLLYAAGRTGATAPLDLDKCGLSVDHPGAHHRRSQDLPDRSAAHLRGGRRDRLSQPCLHLDGAGAHRGLPRLRPAASARAAILPLWHLCGARDFDGGDERAGSAGARHQL